MQPAGTRLQKAIADAGLASRRAAERMILAGQVKVNGEVVLELGTRVVPGSDQIEVEGRRLPHLAASSRAREVWALYKPRACVTTMSDPQGRATVKDFFPKTSARLFPVGRLDYDAEGLILLTNDGEFAQHVAHPSYSVPKTYLVKIKGLIDPASIHALAIRPIIDGKERPPIRVRALHTVNDKTWCEVILKEGINHHIKKLFAGVGHRVLKIKRYGIGDIALETMQPGDSKRLNEKEIASLMEQR